MLINIILLPIQVASININIKLFNMLVNWLTIYNIFCVNIIIYIHIN